MNLRKHELIGLGVQVSGSTDPSLVGLRGTVRDETRNTLVVETARGEKRVPKQGTTFTFEVAGGTRVAGDDLLFRPEDRIKKAR
ncbi:MAG TPA: ribonuclease P protein component 1 [Thermoplasmata archaeon]|jgi:ribonuclease P protein subunit POP4|nr:ribonuclease P protein component 1 [Thermoplasmata archaeon]